ncbi:MAG TPA: pyridoxamine 5'-phosphate oxidase family protein [Actinomycetota bacterium]|nr:pyridoxamine 5'-phosphate oxidase family protein [Actinomycetota bacterium]
MSVPVSLKDLARFVDRYGPNPYLLTVGADSRARATSVTVQWSGELLMAGSGRHTARNLQGNNAVTLLWPPPVPGDYTLIVDGYGEVQDGPAGNFIVMIKPTGAILHITEHPPKPR